MLWRPIDALGRAVSKHSKDQASVENTVGHVANWMIAALRDERFTTLAELKAAIGQRLQTYIAEPIQKHAGSRSTVFAADEQPVKHGFDQEIDP